MMKILNSVLYHRKYNECDIMLLLKKSDKSSNDVFLLWPPNKCDKVCHLVNFQYDNS